MTAWKRTVATSFDAPASRAGRARRSALGPRPVKLPQKFFERPGFVQICAPDFVLCQSDARTGKRKPQARHGGINLHSVGRRPRQRPQGEQWGLTKAK
eukprot:374830-Rhodomonas_salina.1